VEHDRELSLATDVARGFDSEKIAYALIGATALAVHGYSRATLDVDFLTVDKAVFSLAWPVYVGESTKVDVRRGDHDDPLAGVVRFVRAGDAPVDVVVSRWRWEADLIARSPRQRFAGLEIPIPQKADLLLLKISAGGPLDLRDAEELMMQGDAEGVAASLRALDLPEGLRAEVDRFFVQRR